MTEVEYIKAIQEIEIGARDAIKAVRVEYARSNNPIVVGDIVTSCNTGKRIEVREIKIVIQEWRLPYCIYSGPRVTKAGRPFAKNRILSITQDNVVELLDRAAVAQFVERKTEAEEGK